MPIPNYYFLYGLVSRPKKKNWVFQTIGFVIKSLNENFRNPIKGKHKFSIIHPGICSTGLFRYSIPSFVIILCRCLGVVKSVRGGSRAILDVLQNKKKER